MVFHSEIRTDCAVHCVDLSESFQTHTGIHLHNLASRQPSPVYQPASQPRTSPVKFARCSDDEELQSADPGRRHIGLRAAVRGPRADARAGAGAARAGAGAARTGAGAVPPRGKENPRGTLWYVTSRNFGNLLLVFGANQPGLPRRPSDTGAGAGEIEPVGAGNITSRSRFPRIPSVARCQHVNRNHPVIVLQTLPRHMVITS